MSTIMYFLTHPHLLARVNRHTKGSFPRSINPSNNSSSFQAYLSLHAIASLRSLTRIGFRIQIQFFQQIDSQELIKNRQKVTSFPPFGKLLFILFDLISAGLILKISGQTAALLYLFNPLTIGIAVRGNAEPIMYWSFCKVEFYIFVFSGAFTILSIATLDNIPISAILLAIR